MKLEKLGNNAWKKVAVGGICGIAVLSVGVLATSRARYRATESFNLVSGKVNYKEVDFNAVAMYITDDGIDTPIDSVPGIGYELETTKSKCRANGQEISGSIEYRDNKLYFGEITQKGTRCNVYFKLQEDNEIPRITNVVQLNEEEKTSITIQVTAEDNIGITEYWYAIDSDDFTLGSGNTYTFNNLEAGSKHTIKVYVKDIAGNQSVTKSETFSTAADKKKPDQVLGSLGVSSTTTSNGQFTSAETGTGGVYSISDGDGTSYFWRGAVTNNYVRFANKCWRIIRINGDGSIRLILDSNSTTCQANGSGQNAVDSQKYNTKLDDNTYVGYMKGLNDSGTSTAENAKQNNYDSDIKKYLDNWYKTNIDTPGYASYIDEDAGFCNDRTVASSNHDSSSSYTNLGYAKNPTWYKATDRFFQSSSTSWNSTQTPTLKCPNKDRDLFTPTTSSKGNKKLEKPIGLITIDEVVFAGSFGGTANSKFYLYNGKTYWTMSPTNFSGSDAGVFIVYSTGGFTYRVVSDTHGVRPVINLKSTTTFTGSGTQTSPYIVG